MTLKKPYRFILRLLRDLLIICLIGNALVIFMIPGDAWSLRIVLQNCVFSILMGYPSWKGLAYIVTILDRKLPWLKFPIKRLVVQVLSMILFSGLIIFIGFAIWIRMLEGLSFSAVIEYIIPSLKVVYIFLFLSLLVGNSLLFFKNWKDAAVKQEELKRAHLALQYQSLRDQVRPHFLFNSLSSLVTLINTDSKKATRFVHKLSDVYRYVLEQRENELVPLAQEIKFLEDYIFLQKIRFGESLEVHFKLDLDQKRLTIPLALQMLVENAIKHNEVSADNPLVIHVSSNSEQQVVIRNNLQKTDVPEDSPGTGIENLRTRIAFFTDESLVVEEDGSSYTVIIPTIPA